MNFSQHYLYKYFFVGLLALKNCSKENVGPKDQSKNVLNDFGSKNSVKKKLGTRKFWKLKFGEYKFGQKRFLSRKFR